MSNASDAMNLGIERNETTALGTKPKCLHDETERSHVTCNASNVTGLRQHLLWELRWNREYYDFEDNNIRFATPRGVHNAIRYIAKSILVRSDEIGLEEIETFEQHNNFPIQLFYIYIEETHIENDDDEFVASAINAIEVFKCALSSTQQSLGEYEIAELIRAWVNMRDKCQKLLFEEGNGAKAIIMDPVEFCSKLKERENGPLYVYLYAWRRCVADYGELYSYHRSEVEAASARWIRTILFSKIMQEQYNNGEEDQGDWNAIRMLTKASYNCFNFVRYHLLSRIALHRIENRFYKDFHKISMEFSDRLDSYLARNHE